MRAIQLTATGQVDLVQAPEPVPGPHDVVIRTGATTICTSDIQDIRDNAFEAPLPVILGHEGAGTVVAVGPAVTTVRVGDRVAAHPVHPCHACETCRSGMAHLCPNMLHFGLTIPGTFAESFAAREDRVRRLPDAVSFAVGALAEPVCVCLEAIAQARLAPGQRLLVLGDGAFGIMIARLAARSMERAPVIAGRHPERLARAYPATPVLTAAGEDADARLRAASDGAGFDAVILAVANRSAVNEALALLRPGGRLVIFAPLPGDTPVDLFTVLVRELEIVGSVNDRDRFDEAIALLSDETLHFDDLVTHTFPLDAYREALAVAEHDRAHAVKVAFTFPQA
ncbi:MAG: alcohol dehydrogenase catalytic domain-containing protein [Thermomicrobiales bacterium]